MLNIKKIVASVILATALMITAASASTDFMGSTITAGLKAPGNNYYMSYAYVYNGSYSHWSQAVLGGQPGNFARASAGRTCCSNSPSLYKTTNWTYYNGYN